MMVASASVMKLQQSHNRGYMDVDSSVSDMPYRVRHHNNESTENRSYLNPQGNSYVDVENRRLQSSPNRMDSSESSSRTNQSLPSGLSPPLKRMASGGPSKPYQKSAEPSWVALSSSDSQFSDMGVSESQNGIPDRVNSRSDDYSFDQMKIGGATVIKERQYGDNVHSGIPTSTEDDNHLSLSPTSNVRHQSHSSTHSSNGSVISSATGTPSRSISTTPKKSIGLARNQMNFFDDDDDDSWKICSVCGDKATGYHFNALTCEGCKGFFRRSMKNRKNFTCPYNGNCTITKSNRRQCQACRLQKCLRIGMKKECIMSHTEIQMKKNLMLNNRIKRSIMEWKPLEFSPEKEELVNLISESHSQTNGPPDVREEDGIVVVGRDPAASPASSTSSGFSDLINQMTQDIVATAPGSNDSETHLRHFSAIMEYSIKEIIKFCKKIPAFTTLSLKDQITLLKSGCAEILFIKANYTYDRQQNALMCGPGKYYTRESFILGGMSEEYTDCYLSFHHDLSHMFLDDTELACMCATSLFSADRDGLENKALVEETQEKIALALQSYSENRYRCRVRFPKIMSYLTRMRTLNWHISKTLDRIQGSSVSENIKPLVYECVPNV